MAAHAFFEGDVVLRQDRLMVVLASDEIDRRARCVWYERERRCIAVFAHDQLEIVLSSPLRPGHRFVRGGPRPAD
jgi:hypothetical protein